MTGEPFGPAEQFFARFPGDVDLSNPKRISTASLAAICALRDGRPATHSVQTTATAIGDLICASPATVQRAVRDDNLFRPGGLLTINTAPDHHREFVIDDGDTWHGFPAWPILDRLLCPNDIAVLIAICRRVPFGRRGEAVPLAVSELVRILKMSESTVREAIKRLERHSVIDVTRSPVPGTNRWATNRYRIRWQQHARAGTNRTPEGEPTAPERGNQPHARGGGERQETADIEKSFGFKFSVAKTSAVGALVHGEDPTTSTDDTDYSSSGPASLRVWRELADLCEIKPGSVTREQREGLRFASAELIEAGRTTAAEIHRVAQACNSGRSLTPDMVGHYLRDQRNSYRSMDGSPTDREQQRQFVAAGC